MKKKEKKKKKKSFLNLYGNFVYYRSLYYLMYSCKNSVFGKNLVSEISTKMLFVNHITGFLNHYISRTKQGKIFCHVNTNSWKLKVIEKYWDEHDQKWVWPLWSQDSKICCIIGGKQWNKLIYGVFMQIKEN